MGCSSGSHESRPAIGTVVEEVRPARLRLHLVPPPTGPVVTWRTAAEVPVTCPRAGCGGLLRDWPEGKLCGACGRVFLVGELIHDRREVNE